MSRFCGPKFDQNMDFETFPNTINGHTNMKFMVCILRKFTRFSLASSPDSVGCWNSSSTASFVLNGGWSKNSHSLVSCSNLFVLKKDKMKIIHFIALFYIPELLELVEIEVLSIKDA